MSTNQAYLGTNRTNPVHYQKFNLSQFRSQQLLPPHLLHYSGSPGFLDKVGHGITLDKYPDHFISSFDLTSTQEASHDFIHPELTNCSISVQLVLDGALAANVEI